MVATRKPRKPKAPVLRFMSPERLAIFTEHGKDQDYANALHRQVEERLEFACEQFKVTPTGNRELDGNNVLRAHFASMAGYEAKKAETRRLVAAAELDRQQKREQRHSDPSASFPVAEWSDFYGELVKAGDTIRFMTLYGERRAVVRRIEQDITYRAGHNDNICLRNPVVFVVDPWQPEGFENVFEPVTLIPSNSTYNPQKDVGRERTEAEIVAAVDRISADYY